MGIESNKKNEGGRPEWTKDESTLPQWMQDEIWKRRLMGKPIDYNELLAWRAGQELSKEIRKSVPGVDEYLKRKKKKG